jgi:hypothetical protein
MEFKVENTWGNPVRNFIDPETKKNSPNFGSLKLHLPS